jgi:AraC-like DNA-binding protein
MHYIGHDMDNLCVILQRTLGWAGVLPELPVVFAQEDVTGSLRTARRPLLEFLFVTAGRFTLDVGGRQREIAAGDLAVINAHLGNHGELREGVDRYACVSFSVARVAQFDDLAGRPLFEVASLGDRQLVQNQYHRVAAQYYAPRGTVQAFRLKAAVLELLCALSEEAQRHASGGAGSTGVLPALEFLSDHHAEPGLTLGRVAHAARVSGPHLCRLMKAQTGLSPMRYLEEIRVKRAADLLHRTDLDIKRVSHTVGYRDQLYFSRVFRKRMGLSPTEYRTQGRSAPTS